MEIDSVSRKINTPILIPSTVALQTSMPANIQVTNSSQLAASFQASEAVVQPCRIKSDYNIMVMPDHSSLMTTLREVKKEVSQFVEARRLNNTKTDVIYCFDYDDTLVTSDVDAEYIHTGVIKSLFTGVKDENANAHLAAEINTAVANLPKTATASETKSEIATVTATWKCKWDEISVATAEILKGTVKDSSYNCIITARESSSDLTEIREFLDEMKVNDIFPKKSLLFSDDMPVTELEENHSKYQKIALDSNIFEYDEIFTDRGIYIVGRANKGLVIKEIAESYSNKNATPIKDILIVFLDDRKKHHNQLEAVIGSMENEKPTVLSVSMPPDWSDTRGL